MANDESLRMDDLEKRMYSAETQLALIQATMATKQDIAQIHARLAAIEAQLPHFATKADLNEAIDKLRTWGIGLAITLFFSLASLQLGLFFLLRASLQTH